jgi:uncharacterized protein
MKIPHFKYHPDPIRTGALESRSVICQCCNKHTEIAYAMQPYGETDVDDLCPQCIADGSAAQKFNVYFSDDLPLISAGIKQEIIDEIIFRTPSFPSWQQEIWLSCCDDACEFHGDLERDYLLHLSSDTEKLFRDENEIGERLWGRMISSYVPGGDIAIYKFVCRHCQSVKLGLDCS